MDSAAVFGGAMDGGAGAASLAWFIFLKNGFLVSAPYEDADDVAGAGAGACGGERAGAAGGFWTGAGGGLTGAAASTAGANGGDG